MQRLISTTLAGAFLLFYFHSTPAQQRSVKPPEPARQPVAFSHKRHAEAGLNCSRCHTRAKTEEQAGIPVASDCTQCHRKFQSGGALMETLAGYEKSGEPIPWVRVYDLPDFVFFSHQAHSQAKVDCRTCHGPVETRDLLWREREISMKSCIACHQERGASAACNYCHELNK